MDSVSPATLEALVREGVPLERHPTRKDDTDAALALAHARDADEVLFLGPGGGRPDHALANLHLLVAASGWARVRAIDEDGETLVVTPNHPLRLDLPAGQLVSVLPFDGRVEGITYDGLAYPLLEASMEAGAPAYGVSNVALAPPQRIRVRKGRLVVIVPRA
jgi:thiamine pyrophosphokinase